MKFTQSEDQVSILDGLDQLLGSFAQSESGRAVTHSWSAPLDTALAESGFLDIARVEGFGPLDAALVVERIAREANVVEAATSALVAPILPIEPGIRPIALVQGNATRPARFLPVARLLVVDRGDDALLVPIEPGDAEPIESLLAYPYGRLATPDLSKATVFADIALLRRRWRVALAAEAAGCMAGALATMLDHVKTRFAFGKPLGAFQAIQHRLAMAAETAESTKWLAFRAAWSDGEADAAIAAGFAQDRIARFTYDLHQFAGAMGLTLEFPLHLWTYRLRALVSELGGAGAQARHVADAVWGSVA